MLSNNSCNEAKSDPCRYHGNTHTLLKYYGNPDGPNNCPGFTPRPHGATGRGRGGFRGGRGNGGDQNDNYQTNAATNASSNNNNNAPSAASTVTNHTNASGWGAGNQSASNAAADNHWIDSVGAPE
eukprot:scaffold221755_cov30-Attheya_sp.AAC.2